MILPWRSSALSLKELSKVFKVFSDHSDIFTRDNYLACSLLLLLGVRKGELIATRWQDLDINEKFGICGSNKTGVAITIPLPLATLPWFSELYVRACSSENLFPSRRSSKRRAYISDGTLNHALAKLFGKK